MGKSVAAIFQECSLPKKGRLKHCWKEEERSQSLGRWGQLIPAARLFVRKHSLWLTHKFLVKTGWKNTSQVLPLRAY